MTLDNETQRGLLAQVIDHAAKSSVGGADPQSLGQLTALCELRKAVENASVAAPAEPTDS